MGVSVLILVLAISLHLIAFVFAVGAERRRSSAGVVPDEYDEKTYCVYGTDASMVYGLTAFGCFLSASLWLTASPVPVLWERDDGWEVCYRCCCLLRFIMGHLSGGRGMSVGWISEKWLPHQIPSKLSNLEHLSCTSLRKGVFAAGASLILLSVMASTPCITGLILRLTLVDGKGTKMKDSG